MTPDDPGLGSAAPDPVRPARRPRLDDLYLPGWMEDPAGPLDAADMREDADELEDHFGDAEEAAEEEDDDDELV